MSGEKRTIAGRFVVEALVSRGGMGSVYRARDERTGEPVAIKLMLAEAMDARRFQREANVLAELDHVAVVRHVAHGIAEDGEPFLAMEWLEGRDLSDRLAQGPLSIAETIEIGMLLCEGLQSVHDRGIVHRDIKPANLFLVGGSSAGLKLVDFGIARRAASGTYVTKTGLMLGTVGYMAPEQARGVRDVDARADLFSAGAVLYECVTGVSAFSGSSAVAVLAKVLLDDVPSTSALRPEVPDALDALIAHLLQKEPADRPADARSVARALAGISVATDKAVLTARPAAAPLRTGEQRIVTTMLIGAPPRTDEANTLAPGQFVEDAKLFARVVEPFGGESRSLIGGTVVITWPGDAGPDDRANRAAMCALVLQARFPGRSVVLTTARAGTQQQAPLGLALDRGAHLLDERHAPGEVRVDDSTAGLIRARFDLEQRGDLWILRAERSDGIESSPRRLLGREVPCVGRRKEIALLEATFAEVAEESVARVTLVTGSAGIGKSRIAVELRRRLPKEASRWLVARATPLTLDSAGALASSLVRAAAGLRDGLQSNAQHGALRRYVESLAPPDVEQMTEFLGELVGAPTRSTPSVRLRAARDDAKVMNQWLARTFADWIAAETRRGPLITVFEDLHWADAASIAFIDGALADNAETPWLVVALARPEVHTRFPALWSRGSVQESSLSGLTRRAAEELVRAALPDVRPEAATRVVDRAGGNAFFLEELVRAVAAGRSELPETVLAMAEERIARVDADARRVLRAASVFGEQSWLEGVARLLGDPRGEETRTLLEALVRDELLERRADSRFAGQKQYAFRHALLRDAAYAMLPDAERVDAHALAAAWLEGAGEQDPALLSEHWERAERKPEARRYLLAAARAALASGDGLAARHHAERGHALSDEDGRVDFLYIDAMAAGFSADFARALRVGLECLPRLADRSREWFEVLGIVSQAAISTNDVTAVRRAIEALGDMSSPIAPSGSAALALSVITSVVVISGGRVAAEPYARALRDMDARAGDDALVRGWTSVGLAYTATYVDDDPVDGFLLYRRAREYFEIAGDSLGLSALCGIAAFNAAIVGQHPLALALAARATDYSRRGGLHYGAKYAQLAEALTRLRTAPRELMAKLREMSESDEQTGTYSASLLVEAALAADDVPTARAATALLLRVNDLSRLSGEVALAAIAFVERDLDEAQRHLDRATADLPRFAMHPSMRMFFDLIRLQVAQARDGDGAARVVALEVGARLDALAGKLPADAREAFWRDAPHVAETMVLVRSLVGADRPG